jgi:hypothetical protein
MQELTNPGMGPISLLDSATTTPASLPRHGPQQMRDTRHPCRHSADDGPVAPLIHVSAREIRR